MNNVKSRAVSLRQLNLSYMRLRFQQYQLEINIADEYVRGSDQYPRLIETSGAGGEVCGRNIYGRLTPRDCRQIYSASRVVYVNDLSVLFSTVSSLAGHLSGAPCHSWKS